MEKQQAREHIKETLESSFNLETFTHFIKNLLNETIPRNKHYSGNLIPEAFRDHISQYWRVAKYEDPDGEELDIYVIEVKSLRKLERARTALRNFVVNRLQTFEKDYALTAFYCKEDQREDWRFSFVKVEHESFLSDEGKVKTRTELTPAKCASFLVGCHENSYTAQKQLLPLLEIDYANPLLEEIETAFSIEKVTEEFFGQYKEIFAKLTEYFSRNKELFDQENLDISRFSKKLLGQVVFIYFLQKKGWMGVKKDQPWGSGDRRFLRSLYKQAEDNRVNYYNEYLRLIFYEALAKERKSSWYEALSCKIPFLNGGLFEAEYDLENSQLTIPNELFHNTERNKAGDVGTGLLDVFDRYNFTIKEDEPLEREVAVDPEMLGKVFENMLELTERKSKGAFYTPREIVHYMCQESLVHYLDNGLNIYQEALLQGGKKQPSLFGDAKANQHLSFQKDSIKVPLADLQQFIRRGHLFLENEAMALDANRRIAQKKQKSTVHKLKLPESIRDHVKEIDDQLASIKICDPAIGSGAFPVGLLNEIVTVRLVLQSYLDKQRSPYELKRHAIQNSIYGVDIDGSAIDIARLRLWLSLIVDEDFEEIEALPNLDYKIVQGDALIGINALFSFPNVAELEEKKKAFFNTTNTVEKKRLHQEIEALFSQITNGRDLFDFKIYFSEVWHEKGGFDVVIGNPPYVQIQKFSGQQIQKEWQKQGYKTFAKTGDIYCLFYEKGAQLLRNKGCVCLITSNKWMLANYGKKLRNFLVEQTNPLSLFDFRSYHIFETATVDTNILLFAKEKNQKTLQACAINDTFTKQTDLVLFFQKSHIILGDLSGDSWVISNKEEVRIKKRIEAVGIPLKEWENTAIYRGVLTGFNDAFIIKGKIKDELIAKDPKSAEILKPVLNGRDIKRYQVHFNDWWLVASLPALDTNIEDYPAVKKYLQSFGKRLSQTGEKYLDINGKERKSRKKTGHKWFETQDPIAYHEEFEKEKIVWGNLALSAQFSLAAPGMYINAPSPIINTGSKYLLAVLNSTLGDYYIRSLGVTRNGGYFEYKPMFVEKLPVPQIPEDDQQPFTVLVSYLLLCHGQEQKLQAAYFEQLIDGLVYEIYFPKELEAAGKTLLPHLGEFKPLNDDMSEEEKLAVIQAEFDRLYDPVHPIRNNLETLDSVDEVRIIQEAVKK